MNLRSVFHPHLRQITMPVREDKNLILTSSEYKRVYSIILLRLLRVTFFIPVRKFTLYFTFSSLLLFVGMTACRAQGSIGWTEQQIRDEYSKNPDASVFVDYMNGNKNIIVVDQNATAAFNMSSTSNICDRSVFQFRNLDILKGLIKKFNDNYEIISEGRAWKTVLRGHKINIEIRHSEKLNSDMLLFYLND